MKSTYILLIFAVILLSLLVIGAGCSNPGVQSDVVKMRLVGITGGNFSESNGYYTGVLTFMNVVQGTGYPMVLCTTDWSVVKLMSCYSLNLTEIAQNVESHRMSSELSGCYVGTIQKVNC